MDGYRVFRKGRQGRRGGEAVPYLIEGLGCIEFAIGSGIVESLWVRIRVQGNKVDVIVEVYCKPHSQYDNTA